MKALEDRILNRKEVVCHQGSLSYFLLLSVIVFCFFLPFCFQPFSSSFLYSGELSGVVIKYTHESESWGVCVHRAYHLLRIHQKIEMESASVARSRLCLCDSSISLMP